jgi:hypothetical protein
MTLRFTEAPTIAALAQRIAEGLQQIGEPVREDGKLRVFGPIPTYAAAGHNDNFNTGNSEIQFSGWRGLALIGEQPVATFQMAGFKEPGSSISVRGKDSALALYRAFEAAEQFDGARPETYEVRFITVPSLFITAVWLAGPRSVFIPTRGGPGKRPAPKALSQPLFAKLVSRTRKQMRKPARRGEQPSQSGRPLRASNSFNAPLRRRRLKPD